MEILTFVSAVATAEASSPESGPVTVVTVLPAVLMAFSCWTIAAISENKTGAYIIE